MLLINVYAPSSILEPFRIRPPNPLDNPRLTFYPSSNIYEIVHFLKKFDVDLARKDALSFLAQ